MHSVLEAERQVDDVAAIHGEYRIRVLRSREELQEVRRTWEAMQCHPNADFEFYHLIIESRRAEILSPHVLVAESDGVPRAMLVGRVDLRPLDFQFGYSRLFRPRKRILTFVYGGRFGDKNEAIDEAFVGSILKSLQSGEADVAQFSFLNTHSSLFQKTRQMGGFWTLDHFPAKQAHWKFSADTEGKPHISKGLRWQARKLHKDFGGRVSFSSCKGDSGLEEMLLSVEAVARQSYQRGMHVGFELNQEMRDRMQLASKNGWLRCYVLHLDGDPAAFWIGNVYGGIFYSDYAAYVPKYKKHSPGTYVFVEMIEQLWKEGVRCVDFGLGDAFYKQRFGNETWEEASVYVFPPTFKGITLSVLRSLSSALEIAAEKALKQTRLLPKVKRLWRNRLAHSEGEEQ